MREPRHVVIDTYLAEVDQRLLRLPADRRAAEREELAQHLDLLVTAYRARGMDETAAACATIERLGQAGHLGAELERAARRDHPRRMDYARTFFLYAAVVAASNIAVEYASSRIFGDPLPSPRSVATSAVTWSAFSAWMVYVNMRSRRAQSRRNEGIDA